MTHVLCKSSLMIHVLCNYSLVTYVFYVTLPWWPMFYTTLAWWPMFYTTLPWWPMFYVIIPWWPMFYITLPGYNPLSMQLFEMCNIHTSVSLWISPFSCVDNTIWMFSCPPMCSYVFPVTFYITKHTSRHALMISYHFHSTHEIKTFVHKWNANLIKAPPSSSMQ